MRLHLALCLVTVAPLFAEKPMEDRDRFERLVLVVPMTGAGTYADPKRPLYVPAQPVRNPNGILSFQYEISKDGKTAVLELTAANKSAFAAILGDKRPDVKVFEQGKTKKEDAELEIRKSFPNFDINDVGRKVRRPK